MGITRRRLLGCFGAALAGAALPALAQTPRRVGILTWNGALLMRGNQGGQDFLSAMKELGYVEGRDVVYEERYWQRQEEAPDMARDLVARRVDVLIAAGPPSIVAAKSVANRVPVVMMYSADPVAMGLVRSLNAPGGNITGLTWDHGFETQLKVLQILKEALPNMRRTGVLWDATDSAHPVYARHFEDAAPKINVSLVSVPVRTMDDIEPAVARMKREKVDALTILPSGQFTVPKRKEILAVAIRERIPTLYAYVGVDAPGALLQHGPNLTAVPRRAAAYVDRILKGAKPVEIPVEQPDRYDLVVDLTTARKLGIKVPQSVLVRANRVIQ